MINFTRSAACLAALMLSGVAQATVLTLPAPNPMAAGNYNDFKVYPLDLLEKCGMAGDVRCLPVNDSVQASPGQIKEQAVVLGANNNQLDNLKNSPFANGSPVDNHFETPLGGQGSSYQMVDAVNFTGDQANRWDIKLSLLQSYLGANDLVFVFDNNQQGSGAEQWINIWGQARIVNAAGQTVNGLCFELSTGSGCKAAAPVATDYIPVISDFCVDKTTGVGYKIGEASKESDCVAGDYYVKNNLSTGIAEFAAFNAALNDAAKDSDNADLFLSLDVRYFGNNAGTEQLWICSDCNIADPAEVPEPASIPLFLGAALVALAYRRNRK